MIFLRHDPNNDWELKLQICEILKNMEIPISDSDTFIDKNLSWLVLDKRGRYQDG